MKYIVSISIASAFLGAAYFLIQLPSGANSENINTTRDEAQYSESHISPQEQYEKKIRDKCTSASIGKEVVDACIHSSLLRDGIPDGELSMYAQQTLYTISQEQAKNFSDNELKEKIVQRRDILLNNTYDWKMGIEMGAYLHESWGRGTNLQENREIESQLFDKWGPCWGIPEGQCRE